MAGDQLGLFDADEAVVDELGDDLSEVELSEASMFAVPMGDVEAAEEVAAGR